MRCDRRTFLTLAAGAGLSGTGHAQDQPRGTGLAVRSVLELFTSQGCSSCPPADMLFHSLSHEAGVLALSLPVTIWDHLGWKDTLAKTAFSERQKAYAHTRGDRQIYTPQAVINGISHAVGSDLKAIDAARKDTVRHSGILSVLPELTRDGSRWRATLPPAPATPAAEIMLVTFERDHLVQIGKGENSGRTIRYGNIVRSLTRLGSWSGAQATFDIPPQTLVDARESFAVLVQAGGERQPGTILGAVEAPRV